MRLWLRGRAPGRPDRSTSHQIVRLDAGRHGEPGESMCVMELASMLAGERFSDHPRAVCPTISALLRAYNDALGDEQRQQLYRYASEAVGTREGYTVQEWRAKFALSWARSRMYGRKRRWAFLIKRERLPVDASPNDIAEFVVRSLGRRPTAETHQAMHGLIDWMIGMHDPGEAPAAAREEAPIQLDASAHAFSL